jgi:hypothetical protein
MSGEIEKQIKEIIKDEPSSEKLIKIIRDAGQEYPCLSCPSKDECQSFKWFIKWFGEVVAK